MLQIKIAVVLTNDKTDLRTLNNYSTASMLVDITQKWFIPVLRIHDILELIRVCIRGSMPLTNVSGSCYFLNLQDANKKITLKKFSAQYFLKVHLHYFSKIKSHKIAGIKVFLTVFAWLQKNPDPHLCSMVTNGSGSRMFNRIIFPRSYETTFWVKIVKFRIRESF